MHEATKQHAISLDRAYATVDLPEGNTSMMRWFGIAPAETDHAVDELQPRRLYNYSAGGK